MWWTLPFGGSAGWSWRPCPRQPALRLGYTAAHFSTPPSPTSAGMYGYFDSTFYALQAVIRAIRANSTGGQMWS